MDRARPRKERKEQTPVLTKLLVLNSLMVSGWPAKLMVSGSNLRWKYVLVSTFFSFSFFFSSFFAKLKSGYNLMFFLVQVVIMLYQLIHINISAIVVSHCGHRH